MEILQSCMNSSCHEDALHRLIFQVRCCPVESFCCHTWPDRSRLRRAGAAIHLKINHFSSLINTTCRRHVMLDMLEIYNWREGGSNKLTAQFESRERRWLGFTFCSILHPELRGIPLSALCSLHLTSARLSSLHSSVITERRLLLGLKILFLPKTRFYHAVWINTITAQMLFPHRDDCWKLR